jgi:hypothetical protein
VVKITIVNIINETIYIKILDMAVKIIDNIKFTDVKENSEISG